eukprot:14401_4
MSPGRPSRYSFEKSSFGKAMLLQFLIWTESTISSQRKMASTLFVQPATRLHPLCWSSSLESHAYLKITAVFLKSPSAQTLSLYTS